MTENKDKTFHKSDENEKKRDKHDEHENDEHENDKNENDEHENDEHENDEYKNDEKKHVAFEKEDQKRVVCEKCSSTMSVSNSNSILKDDINLKSITNKYSHLEKDKSIVYAICSNTDVNVSTESYLQPIRSRITQKSPPEWIVILQKRNETETSETQWSCDKDYAQFFGNVFKVIEIFNVNDSSITRDHISDFDFSLSGPVTHYRKGYLVRANDYDEKKCEGIQYYKTLKRAYFSRPKPDDYSGNWMVWDYSGSLTSSKVYVHREQREHREQDNLTENLTDNLMNTLRRQLAKVGVNLFM
jgi:hypothetical protein